MIKKTLDSIEFSSDLPESTKESMYNPAASLVGQAIRGIAHKVFDPLVKFNIIRDQEMNDFADKVRNKTDQIPFENRDDSKLGLTLKSFEDSVYQLNSEELRDMFANLISSSVDDRLNANVLPAFSTTLKDLSEADAKLLKRLYKLNAVAKVDMVLRNDRSSLVLPYIQNIILYDDFSTEYNPVAINSLQRLGLIGIYNDVSLTSSNYEASYRDFKKGNSEYFSYAKREMEKINNMEHTYDYINVINGYITMTPLGKQFGKVVIAP